MSRKVTLIESNSAAGDPTALLVVDVDGTIRQGIDDALGRFVNGPDDVRVFPEAVTLLQEWRSRGGRVIFVSNQGGIALGLVSAESVMAAMKETLRQARLQADTIVVCPHHPDAKDPGDARCWCRKPSPGGLVVAAYTLGMHYDEHYPSRLGLFVGDREEDRECARLCSFDFMWAKEWRATAGQFGGGHG